MNSRSVPRIHYKFIFCFAYSLSILRLYQEFTIYFDNSLWIDYFFANLLWIHYSFRENTMKALCFAKINYGSIIYLREFTSCWTQVWPVMTLNDLIWPQLILVNPRSESPTKFWVETYVYLIYFDQPGRFDPYWTDLTQVWPLMTLIDLENIKSEFLRKFRVETYVYWIYFDQPGRFDPKLDGFDPSLTSGDPNWPWKY